MFVGSRVRPVRGADNLTAQLVTEMSTRSRKKMFVGSRVRLVRVADNLTAIYEPIV
jgi:hypothetical protein